MTTTLETKQEKDGYNNRKINFNGFNLLIERHFDQKIKKDTET